MTVEDAELGGGDRGKERVWGGGRKVSYLARVKFEMSARRPGGGTALRR